MIDNEVSKKKQEKKPEIEVMSNKQRENWISIYEWIDISVLDIITCKFCIAYSQSTVKWNLS